MNQCQSTEVKGKHSSVFFLFFLFFPLKFQTNQFEMCHFPHMLIYFCECFVDSSNFHFVWFFMAYWSRTQCTSMNEQRISFRRKHLAVLFCFGKLGLERVCVRVCLSFDAKQFIWFFFEMNWISNIIQLLKWKSEIHERELRFFNLSSSQLCQQKCDFVTHQIINELLNAGLQGNKK